MFKDFLYYCNIPKQSSILVIDDNEYDLIRIHEIIESNCPETQILTARNGIEGMKVLEELHGENIIPNLVISDLNMPLMDGFETYSSLKSDDRFLSVNVVLFTTSDFSKKIFQEKGIVTYVKPFCVIQYENTVLEKLREYKILSPKQISLE